MIDFKVKLDEAFVAKTKATSMRLSQFPQQLHSLGAFSSSKRTLEAEKTFLDIYAVD